MKKIYFVTGNFHFLQNIYQTAKELCLQSYQKNAKPCSFIIIRNICFQTLVHTALMGCTKKTVYLTARSSQEQRWNKLGEPIIFW